MTARSVSGSRTLLLAIGLALSLAGGLTACSGRSGDAPPAANASTPPTARAMVRPSGIPAEEWVQCVNGAALAGQAGNSGLAGDCALLLAAKDTLAGTATLNWSASIPIADWDGVATDGRPKRVQQLTLHDRTLNGSIPAELGELSQLSALRLARNQLSGAIPAELGNLTWLRHLDLGENRLSGAIPAELGSLMSLGHLDLGENRLSGAIPAELRNLLYLHNLYLDGNRLEGAIPPLRGS